MYEEKAVPLWGGLFSFLLIHGHGAVIQNRYTWLV